MKPLISISMVLIAGPGPADCSVHRFESRFIGSGPGQTLIEHHHDVAAQGQLHVDHTFGRKKMLVTIEVRAKEHACIGNLAQCIEAEDLEPARIGQNGTRPSHKFMQTPLALDELVPRPEKEVVGVGQDNLRSQILEKITRCEALYGALCSDGHEDRRLDGPMSRMEDASASARLRASGDDFKT